MFSPKLQKKTNGLSMKYFQLDPKFFHFRLAIIVFSRNSICPVLRFSVRGKLTEDCDTKKLLHINKLNDYGLVFYVRSRLNSWIGL
jgi:hypothetical protein